MFVEETKVDPKNGIMKLYSRNVTFDGILKTEETCTYTPSKDNNKHTDFVQVCKVSSCVSGLSSALEDFVISNFQSNASKGQEIMESAIEMVHHEKRHFIGSQF